MPDQKAQNSELGVDETPCFAKERACPRRGKGKLPALVVRLVACGDGGFFNLSVFPIR
jgi:hypothetical protein